jgi:hypothetical protein
MTTLSPYVRRRDGAVVLEYPNAHGESPFRRTLAEMLRPHEGHETYVETGDPTTGNEPYLTCIDCEEPIDYPRGVSLQYEAIDG